jgi:hypothetical protein
MNSRDINVIFVPRATARLGHLWVPHPENAIDNKQLLPKQAPLE